MTTVFNLNRYSKIVANDLSLNGSISSALGGLSQWDDSDSDIYFSGGNVGIGTTNPGAKLHIDGISPSVTGLILRNTSGINRALEFFNSSNQYRMGFHYDNENIRLYVVDSYRNPMVTFASNGKVGIGTASPAQLLHLSNDSGQTIFHMTCRESGSSANDGFSIVQSAENHLDFIQRENANMVFYTNNTERVKITNVGNVGIGTTSPDQLLQVKGTNSDYPAMRLSNDSANFDIMMTGSSFNDALFTNRANGNILFETTGNVGIGTTDPQSTLDVNGIVRTRGTHTSTANGPYYDSGFTTHYILAGHSGNGTNTLRVGTYNNAKMAITHNYERSLTGQSNYLGGIDFERSGAESGLMRVRGGFVNASGSSYAASDDRIKHNEKIITDGISIVKQMIPKTYDMTDDMYDASYNGPLNKYKPSAGYIAQDIQAIPDLSFCVIDTSEYDDSGNLVKLHPLALNYTALMTYHTAAIKQQQEQIELDKAKIASLESQLADVLQRLSNANI